MSLRHSVPRRWNPSGKPLSAFPLLAAVGLLLLTALPGAAQLIDLNANGMCDVWEQVYGGSGLDPDADADGDGFSNLSEALAGTNPFDAASFPKISTSSLAPTVFSVTIPCQAGKQYQLQSVTQLGSVDWAVETNLVARTNGTLTLTAPPDSGGKFFRTAVADVDTDGDGVSDYEEYLLGLNPFNGLSNGKTDGNGQLMSDLDYATGKFASQNIFSIVATDPATTQPDPGQSPTDLGTLTVSRGGFALKATTVALALGGPGAGYATEGTDHSALPRSVAFPAGVSSQTIPVTPLANTNLKTSVIAMLKLLPGTNYAVSASSNASVVIYPTTTPNGTGLSGNYYTNSSTTYSSANNFNATNLVLSRIDPVIDFNFTNGITPALTNGLYSVRWTGQVQPQYSEAYYFVVNSDDGCKLWVNDQLIIDKWQSQSAGDSTGIITLQGGARYNIKLEYLRWTGPTLVHLYWYSASQSKQIIPSTRLYPTNFPAPPAVTSPLSAVAFLGQPFSFTVTGANTPTNFTATGLPPGLSFYNTNGAISGVPNLAGDYQVAVTVRGTNGLGAAVVNIQVLDTGSSVVREVWTGVTGTNIADIPTGTPATFTNVIGSLEGITNFGVNYGERIRGYLTAPATGNYYFWLAGSDAAELWIANDSEPVNKLRRAHVRPATGGTAPRNWNTQTNQQSKWLSLVAGQKYYVEILHKAGTTPNDNWAVAWQLDPTGNSVNNVPTNVVPGYVLGRYYPLPVTVMPGTLYSANMLAQNGAVSSATGTATLQLSADGTQAILRRSFSGLTSIKTGEHIHSDPYLGNPSTILFDVDETPLEADGSYIWNIVPVGTLQAADIIEIIREGKAYLNIHTVNYPGGEINGHFTLADGSQTFIEPPAEPAWADDHSDTNAAARFLIQSTFGPSAAEIAAVRSMGYSNWINNQISLPVSHHLPVVLANRSADPNFTFPSSLIFNTWWMQSITAPDQLRQRVAFALSEIIVASEAGPLVNNATAVSDYYDTLLDGAFGNFRDLLKAVTLSPAMGRYLDMRGNDKGDITTGLHANENYAREILQLFSIGLYRLWPDGSLVLNSQNALVPTYDQNVIMGFASTFTGWNYYQTNQTNGRLPTSWSPSANWTNPMVLVPTHHELDTKRLLDNVITPAAWGSQTNSATTNFDLYCSQNFEDALDSIFANPNVGPFICRQLIQRLVTSHPSREYLYRVVQKFNDNGSGVRGDLAAVIRAILLDYEARSTNMISLLTYGKQREPVCRVTAPARAFPAPPDNGGLYAESGTQTITVTTTNAHRLNNNDVVRLNFTDTSGKVPPPSQGYTVTVTGPTTFTVNAPGLSTGAYGQTNNVITVNISSHGVATNYWVYLQFTTGAATSGVYQVTSVISTSRFTVATADPATTSGNCLMPRFTGGGYTVSSKTNLSVITALPQGLLPGDDVFLNFNAASSPADARYTLATTPDSTHFTSIIPTNSNQTQNSLVTYPLASNAIPLTRSGTVALQSSTWGVGDTDSDPTASLSQTPLSSPTVFNFFFPDYQFPGTLASAGLTTPEFQLTSDIGVMLQMNFLGSGVLTNSSSNANSQNTNGLSSFTGGDGDIVLDLGPWMTTNYTAAAGIPSLVDNLNTLLLAGQLSAAAKTNIVNCVTNTANFPYTTPTPTATQMRDRVRAVVHFILCSPDFTIQR